MLLKLWQLFFVFGGIFTFATGGKYDGHKVYEVTPNTTVQVEMLRSLASQVDKYDVFSLSRTPGQSTRLLMSAADEEHFKALLQQQQIQYKLTDSNYGRTLNIEVAQNRLLRQLKPYAGTGRLGTERYYSHDEINAYLDDLAKRYPARVFVKNVGKTYEGRLMKTITITNGDERSGKNVILMDGGFHAREWISPAAVVYSIGELVENFEEHASLLVDYDWIVLPVVNADGYEYTQLSSDTRLWRKTRQPLQVDGKICYGTDPNRNFGFHWRGPGASSNHCSEIFAGPRAFSEPEAVVVRDIIHSLRGRGIMYLTVHSFGSFVLYPWGWSDSLPDTWEDLHEVGQAGADAIRDYSGSNYTVGSSARLLGEAAGASDDYAFNDGFAISFTMELPGGGVSGFDPPAQSINHLVKEAWVGIRAMAERVTRKYPAERLKV